MNAFLANVNRSSKEWYSCIVSTTDAAVVRAITMFTASALLTASGCIVAELSLLKGVTRSNSPFCVCRNTLTVRRCTATQKFCDRMQKVVEKKIKVPL